MGFLKQLSVGNPVVSHWISQKFIFWLGMHLFSGDFLIYSTELLEANANELHCETKVDGPWRQATEGERPVGDRFVGSYSFAGNCVFDRDLEGSQRQRCQQFGAVGAADVVGYRAGD